jgi:hypothetical protein
MMMSLAEVGGRLESDAFHVKHARRPLYHSEAVIAPLASLAGHADAQDRRTHHRESETP